MLHLIPLRARLLEELRAIGREQWVEEECAALAALAVPEKAADPDAYMKLKGARELDARGLAVLRELHAARETLALRLDCPIYVEESVLKNSRQAATISDKVNNEELRRWLEGLNDEDLGRYKM